jgi:hypothetical protein
MTPLDDRDGEIRELFAEQRSMDRLQLPDYRTMRGRAATPPRTIAPLARSLVRAAAAVVVLAAGIMVMQRLHRTGTSHSVAASSIASWKSPTAFLLRTPAHDLLRAVPDLDSSVLDRLTPVTKSKESGS